MTHHGIRSFYHGSVFAFCSKDFFPSSTLVETTKGYTSENWKRPNALHSVFRTSPDPAGNVVFTQYLSSLDLFCRYSSAKLHDTLACFCPLSWIPFTSLFPSCLSPKRPYELRFTTSVTYLRFRFAAVAFRSWASSILPCPRPSSFMKTSMTCPREEAEEACRTVRRLRKLNKGPPGDCD